MLTSKSFALARRAALCARVPGAGQPLVRQKPPPYWRGDAGQFMAAPAVATWPRVAGSGPPVMRAYAARGQHPMDPSHRTS